MSVERVVNSLITDIDQLNRLYRQLRDVPREVQELVGLLADARTRLIVAARRLARTSLDELDLDSDVSSGKPFSAFRSRLLDLELMLDPDQFLHHSGAGAHNVHAVRWDSFDHGDVQDFCVHYKEHLIQLDSDTSVLLRLLNPHVRLTPETEERDIYNSKSPSLGSLRSFALGSSGKSQSSSPASLATRDGRKRRSPRVKTEEEIIFDKFVQQYSKLGNQGKRKRPGEAQEAELVGLEALSRQLPFPFPAGQEDLQKLEQQIRGAGNFDDSDIPEWNLDDLRSALPPSSTQSVNTSPKSSAASFTTIHTARSRGKQRASTVASTIHLTEYGMTEYNSSSSGSLYSIPTREGSVFSVESRDRMYEDGACKLWHHQGGRSMAKIDIARTEIRRDVQTTPNGKTSFAVIIVSTTVLGHEIQDPLWIPSLGVNSSPFLEHIEVVQTFQRHDPSVNFIVRFAPNPHRHPQYSFTHRTDCWDFLQAITDKILCASIDVELIKSAATHATNVESGTETIQIWEDAERTSSRRVIKFYRNKNENVPLAQRVVELELEWLRQPHRERRSGRTLIELREVGNAITKELRYLKIAFSNADAEAGFMHECGFRKQSVASISTVNTERMVLGSPRHL